ncbi:trace amine-associated receptor 13c-like [Anabas testudineus]|uniref:trace amine-associated receptor 13c-like n=1 Tax=Anabas testudineus TaxID=64144 RepID=UPI000E45A126|nr:trace amine-associated receptor 13c-like [Anabas testudineus]
MVLISIDRYVAICDPLHYSIKVTPKRVQVRAMRSQIVVVSYQRSVSLKAKKSEMKAARTLGVVVELCFPHLNTSCRKPKRPHSHTVLIYIVLSFISLLTASLNLLVIISISHFKQLHTTTNLLLLSLAVSDFSVSVPWLFQIMLVDGCWFLGDIMCSLYCILDYIMTSTSIGTMVLISVDRYVAICDPLHYPTRITPRRVQTCVILCWICSFFFVNMIMKDNLKQPGRYNSCAGECVIIFNKNQKVADLILTFIVPITAIVVLYMRVFFVAVSQARAMRSHIVFVSYQRSVSVSAKKSEVKAARTLGVVIVVFLLCLCPYFCVALIDKDEFNTSSSAFILYLFYFNSCLNPIVYALFYPWFRKSIRMIVTLQIFKPGSCETNVV